MTEVGKSQTHRFYLHSKAKIFISTPKKTFSLHLSFCLLEYPEVILEFKGTNKTKPWYQKANWYLSQPKNCAKTWLLTLVHHCHPPWFPSWMEAPPGWCHKLTLPHNGNLGPPESWAGEGWLGNRSEKTSEDWKLEMACMLFEVIQSSTKMDRM